MNIMLLILVASRSTISTKQYHSTACFSKSGPNVSSRQPRSRVNLWSSDLSKSVELPSVKTRIICPACQIYSPAPFHLQINALLAFCSRPDHVIKPPTIQSSKIRLVCQMSRQVFFFQGQTIVSLGLCSWSRRVLELLNVEPNNIFQFFLMYCFFGCSIMWQEFERIKQTSPILIGGSISPALTFANHGVTVAKSLHHDVLI